MLRVVFMGTPDFAVSTLAGILAGGHEVVAVYTQPPRPAGRGMAERKSPVHLLAERNALPVFVPATLKTEEEARAFAAHRADVAVVVAYGLILPRPVLAAPREGCLSIPDVRIDIERPSSVTVQFLDREGKPQELVAEGLMATVVQHEIDHLNGKLIIDFLSRLKRDIIVRRFKKLAKETA